MKRKKKSKIKRENKDGGVVTRITIFVLTLLFIVLVASTAFRFSKVLKNFTGERALQYTRVEVLNGCGVDNLAYRVSLYLREKGFDVVEISNVAGPKMERTIIIERVDGGMKNAKRLGEAINCSNMSTMIDSTLFLEATLILGEDYQKFFSKEVLEKEIF
jgi:hypothetical protein